MDPTVDEPGPRPTFARTLIRPPDYGAAAVGVLFWAQSMRPSLLPRPPLVQGVIAAVCLLVGYGLAGLVLVALRAQRRRTGWFSPSDEACRVGRIALAVVAGLVVVVEAFLWLGWQNDRRDMVSMPHLGSSALVSVVVATMVATMLLGVVARSVGFVVGRLDRWLGQRVPSPLAHAIVGVVVVVLVLGFTNRVLIERVVGGIDQTFGAGDRTTEPGVERPTSRFASGGPESLVPWETLGRQGRSFVAGATTTAELRSCRGRRWCRRTAARADPGLRRPRQRPHSRGPGRAAVAELERTGAFDRSVLCLVTVTGTGWINPVAASAVEYLRGGDTAIVGMQYSYLPSWISTLVDQDQAVDAASALGDAVVARWSELPESSRPRLIVYGESLGSFGSEGAVVGADAEASLKAATSRADGVLWVAPTNSNPVWNQVTDERDPSSPIWQPTFGDGQEVVFVTSPNELPIGPPEASRVVYTQHASDPVTWWNPSILWSPPEWTSSPKGPDVPDQLGWFPFVTWLQVTGDLVEGFSTPPGHGHNFNNIFAAGFASLAAPPGWTADDTERLDAVLAPAAEDEPSL